MTGGGRQVDVATALETSLAARAGAVGVEPTTAARAAVERQVGRRARRRQVRRTAVATVAAAVLLGAAGLVARSGGGRGEAEPEVAASASAEDPASFGLPRLVLDPSSGLTATSDGTPLVAVEPVPTSDRGFPQVQVFRPDDALLPAIFAPWSPAGAGLDLPSPGGGHEAVPVGGAEAVLTGSPPGWTTLSWRMPDGTAAYLYAYGVERADLLAVATGLDRPTDGGSGYVARHLPAGFTASTRTPDAAVIAGPGPVSDGGSPPGDEPAPGSETSAGYRARYGGGGVVAELAVWEEGALAREEQAMRVLAEARSAEPIEVAGRAGLLARHVDGSWSVGWSTDDRTTAALRITGADRSQVDAVVAALRAADADEWAAAHG